MINYSQHKIISRDIKKMDLSDPSIRKEFITHILSLIPPNVRNIPPELLNDFILIVMDNHNNNQFPVSAKEAAKFLGVRVNHVNRMVDPDLATKHGNHVLYEEGKDYVKKGGKFFLSVDCFEDICMRMRGDVAKKIRFYFRVVESAYREWFGNASYERRKVEDPEVTKYKTEVVDYDDVPVEPMAYRDKFVQRGVEYEKAGHSGNVNTRMRQLAAQYPGKHHLEQYVASSHPQAIEECFHMMARSARVPCEGHPCPEEVYFAKDIEGKIIMDSCKDGLDEIKKKISQKLGAISPSSSSTHDSKERKPPKTEEKSSTLVFRGSNGKWRDLADESKSESGSDSDEKNPRGKSKMSKAADKKSTTKKNIRRTNDDSSEE